MKSPTSKIAAEIINSMALFTGVDETMIHGLAVSARIAEHRKGDILLEQNQPITRYYIIIEGWCGLMTSNQDGQESIFQIMTRGDFLPEPDFSSRQYNAFNIQALTNMRLLALPPSLLHNALKQSPQLMQNMLAAAKDRIKDLRDHVEQLTLRNAEERVGRFLLQMRSAPPADGRDIELPFDKNHIASYLGIKSETLSRTLQLFKERGFSVDRNHVKAPGFHSLCEFCDSTSAEHCDHVNTEDCPNPVFIPAS